MSPAPREADTPRAPGQEEQAGQRPALTSLAHEPWPRGASRKATMNIGAVLAVLKREFPAVSHSKIRFLEEQGLVTPQRTPAGYRVFSEADVERLRFALAAQRDSFLPLRVIRERLAALDAGLGDDVPLPAQPAAAGGGRMLPDELATLAGASPEQVAELDRAGLISTDAGGRYPASSLTVVQLASELAVHGLDTRHLRLMRSAADRQVDVVAQLTSRCAAVRTRRRTRGAGSGPSRPAPSCRRCSPVCTAPW
ncbi:transcriptional regulator FtsR [Litorihabitans aurantiacus]|uniref:HTH merR-type domain-containing protein n=1 Tax=Litorihabitans aurantiacus TaxID=1930061 RepID=A0AA37UUA8_9MICO|nr:MerR family transcriptional regulator [Litorihabitans aurantiacus]GMA31250.1 hypothetical protein GCM10025875_12420 [Litorihabitans aurantiacus]